jgi:hypothetical protein
VKISRVPSDPLPPLSVENQRRSSGTYRIRARTGTWLIAATRNRNNELGAIAQNGAGPKLSSAFAALEDPELRHAMSGSITDTSRPLPSGPASSEFERKCPAADDRVATQPLVPRDLL